MWRAVMDCLPDLRMSNQPTVRALSARRLRDPGIVRSFFPRNQSAVVQQFEPAPFSSLVQATDGIAPDVNALA